MKPQAQSQAFAFLVQPSGPRAEHDRQVLHGGQGVLFQPVDRDLPIRLLHRGFENLRPFRLKVFQELKIRIQRAYDVLGVEHGAHEDYEIVRHEHVLRLPEPRDAEECLGHRPLLERARRKIGNDLGEAAAELGAVHLTPEHAKIDGGIQKPVGILMNEGVGEGRELAARGTVEEPDESEVMQADPSLGGNENVARVGIAVECAKDESLIQVSIDEVIGEARPVGFDRRIVDSPSAAPLLHNDSLADETFNDVRDVNRGRICKGGYETLDIAGFLTEIASRVTALSARMSRSICVLMPARRTLTMTWRPSCSSAVWTCATEAAASALSSKCAKSSLIECLNPRSIS